MPEGIEVRKTKHGNSYRAVIFDVRSGRKVTRTFARLAEAKGWRRDAVVALREGRMRVGAAPTLGEAVKAWLEGAEAGVIRKRGRGVFKPSTLRAVEQNYRLRLEDEFGSTRLDRLSQLDLQDWVDRLDAEGLNPSTIESSVLPLRLVFRHARTRAVVAIDPTDGLELPEKPRGQRVPPSPKHAARLLEVAPEADRAMWATAMLAGPRRGELLALRWEDVDLEAGVLRIERSYDPASQTFGTPKSRQGVRVVPISRTLSPYLKAHMLRSGRRAGLVFGDHGRHPISPSAVQKRADLAWEDAAKLAKERGGSESDYERVTLHACRHLYASVSIAAGVNAHALCKYMGHSSIAVTYDLYGHLFPGNEAEASALLDAYLDREFTAVTSPSTSPRTQTV